MHWLDYLEIFVYLSMLAFVGFIVRVRASGSVEAYFLGGRKIPWWLLSWSGMASNLDITGTMINTALVFAFGLSGLFIEFRGGVVLCLALLLTFMGKWYRRSGVLTLAEWMTFRFGKGLGGRLAQQIAAVSALILTVALVSYFTLGAGRFVGTFMGFEDYLGLPTHFWGAIIMISLATFYTVASGLWGVIVTDLVQSALILFCIAYVCALAFGGGLLPEQFTVNLTSSEGPLAFFMTKDAWVTPSFRSYDIPSVSEYAQFNGFFLVVGFFFSKSILEGMGGVTGYMAQRYYAVKTDREATLMSFLWVALLSLRWPFIVAVAMLGIYYHQNIAPIADPEAVLPTVLINMIPTGVKGLLIAAMMAAAMSTFDSTLNAGAAYWVKDVYQTWINPKADEKTLVRQARWASVGILLLGLSASLLISSINEIWGWFNMSLSAGLFMPLVVRWFWHRVNGYGFFAGTLAGMIAAFVVKGFFPELSIAVAFLACCASSLAALVLVSLLTPVVEQETLLEFYRKTRPFGFWGPLRKCVSPEECASIDAENRRSILASLIAVPWQVSFFLMGMLLMVQNYAGFRLAAGFWVLASVFLYGLCLARGPEAEPERRLNQNLGTNPQ